jgi:hypothetical protein
MEVVNSTETSVYFYQATLRYISEDSSIRNHGSESLKCVENFNYILFILEYFS